MSCRLGSTLVVILSLIEMIVVRGNPHDRAMTEGL